MTQKFDSSENYINVETQADNFILRERSNTSLEVIKEYLEYAEGGGFHAGYLAGYDQALEDTGISNSKFM